MYVHAKSFLANRFPVILASFFCAMNVAFLTIPYIMERHPGETRIDAAPTTAYPIRESRVAIPDPQVPLSGFTESDTDAS